MIQPVPVTPRNSDEQRLWKTTLEVAAAMPAAGWTLIGAQMVFLQAAAFGREPGRTSGDLDVLVDVRLVTSLVRDMAERLIECGFGPDVTVDGRGHRFRRGEDVVDLLAPEGTGSRSSLETVPGARTIAVPGGSQALRRTERHLVDIRGVGVAELPSPNLLGAILLKARAIDAADDPDKHRRDLGLLLSLVRDPGDLARELAPAERGWLRRRRELLDPEHAAYRGNPDREDAAAALALMLRAVPA